jgi:hypothetical protein
MMKLTSRGFSLVLNPNLYQLQASKFHYDVRVQLVGVIELEVRAVTRHKVMKG